MIRGLYSSATGMISQSRRIDVMGNNLTNADTAGFKSEEATLKSFDEEMTRRMQDDVEIGTLSIGVGVSGVSVDFTQGPLERTGQSTDLAISGGGFFAVQDAGGVKYTRAGNFAVDEGGYLALPSGERLLGTDGNPILVGGSDFAVSSDGAVTVNGTQVGAVGLYLPQTANGILKRTDGFYAFAAPSAAGGSILQGYLENSNTDPVTEMTGLMEASRSFQSCQQSYQVGLDTLDRLISQVGTLKG